VAIFTSYPLIGRNINTDSIFDIDYRFLRNFYSSVTSDDVNGFSKAPLVGSPLSLLTASPIEPHATAIFIVFYTDSSSSVATMTAKSTRVKSDFGALARVSEIPFEHARDTTTFSPTSTSEHALRLVVHDVSNVRFVRRPDEKQTSAVRLVTRSPFLRSCKYYILFLYFRVH